MTRKMILRTTLAAFLALMLVAAPVAAILDRPAERGQTTRSLELGDLLSRAWALLLGERMMEREDAGEREPSGPQSMSDANEEESGSDMDPDG